MVTAGGHNLPDALTDWKDRTDQINRSTNNTFLITLEDLNVEIGTPNLAARAGISANRLVRW
jgi:hypothetical protein